MSQPPITLFSTTQSNPQSISSQHCITSRATTASDSGCNSVTSANYNVTRTSPTTTNLLNRLAPQYPLNYSSTPDISSTCTLSSYCTANPHDLRNSQSCSLCNLSTYYHPCNMPSPRIESSSNRHVYNNSRSENYVQSTSGSFHRITNSQLPPKNVLNTRLEGAQNSERFVSSISCPNIPNILTSPPVGRTVAASTSIASSSNSYNSQMNMPPPVVTARGIPTPPIPLKKLSSLNLPAYSGQSATYVQSLESMTNNQLAYTRPSDYDRLKTMQWNKAISTSNLPGSNNTTEDVGCSTSLSSDVSSSLESTVHYQSKTTNIKQPRKRRKINIIPLHKIASFHHNYMKKCKSKTQLDHINIKKEK